MPLCIIFGIFFCLQPKLAHAGCTPTGSYTIAPTSLTLDPGTSGNVVINAYNFNADWMEMTWSGADSSIATVNPTHYRSINGFSGPVGFTVYAGAPGATSFTIEIDAMKRKISNPALGTPLCSDFVTFPVTVNAPPPPPQPDFTVQNGIYQEVTQGGTTAYYIFISCNSTFLGPVTMSAGAAPFSNVTFSWQSTTVACNSNAVLQVSAGAEASPYNVSRDFNITGFGVGVGSKSAIATLKVLPQTGSVSVRYTINGVVQAGTINVQYYIYNLTHQTPTVASSTYAIPITHTNIPTGSTEFDYVSGVPSGYQYQSVTPASVYLNPGSTITFTINFISPSDFSFQAGVTNSVTQASSSDTSIFVTCSYAYTGPITMDPATTTLLTGVTFSWVTNPVACNSNAVLRSTATATASPYNRQKNITISGTGPGVGSRSTTIGLTVTPQTGNITMKYSLNGVVQPSPNVTIQYPIYNATHNATSVSDWGHITPIIHNGIPTGQQVFSYTSGGPAGYVYDSVSPSNSQYLNAGANITFTINFVQPTADIKVRKNLGDSPVDGPITTSYGTGGYVSWSSTNASSCTVTGSPGGASWSGPSNAGQATGVLGTTQTYTITCTNGGLSVTDTATINVFNGSPPSVIADNYNSDSNVQCGQVKISWTAGAGASTYRVFRNTDSNPTGSVEVTTSDISATTFTDTTVPQPFTQNYYYFVKSRDASGNYSNYSAPTSAIAPVVCGVILSTSDIDVIAVNHNTVSTPLPCSTQTESFTTNTALILSGDVVTFRVNICNTGTKDIDAAATPISITHTLTNLTKPTNGWNAIYNCNSQCSGNLNEVSVGSGGSNIIQLTLTNGVLPRKINGQPGVWSVTFDTATLKPTTANSSLHRFQNSADYSANPNTFTYTTPFYFFYDEITIPIIKEIQ